MELKLSWLKTRLEFWVSIQMRDRHIAILSVLEINAKDLVKEVARHFIDQTSHTKRRKRRLGRIALKCSKRELLKRGA